MGKTKSAMWKYFDNVTVNGVKYVRCRDTNCEGNSNSKLYIPVSGDGSTCGLWRHLRSHHPDISKTEDALKEDKKASVNKKQVLN